MNKPSLINLLTRYIFLLALGLNLWLFYIILTPLTVYPVFYITNLFFDSALLPPTTIILNEVVAELIPACIAGAAYYFLLILNLSTSMPLKKRINNLTFLIATFLTLNILRIFIFIALLLAGFQYFDLAHRATWYIGSTLLLLAIWFTSVYLSKIKDIPFYTDLKSLYKATKHK